VTYHPDGAVASRGRYQRGKREGRWTATWPNGNPKYDGVARNDRWQGELIVWKDDGTLNEDESGLYDDGVKVD
jgi:antitoxin component YwqK of YwqJK toxin-antitoxin module